MNKCIKQISMAVSAAAALCILCSCGKGGGLFAEPTPSPIPSADATEIITLDDAKNAIENKYDLILDGGNSVTDGNISTASYLSNPIGSGDPVIVKVINRTDKISADDIWNDYENTRILRTSSELIDGIGEDAYIAYPSIHVYDRGCEIIITASSGSGDEQKAVLESLAKTAAAKIEEIMPEEPAAQ